MKKLLVYLKDYKKETVLAPLFKLLEASFELLVPLVMAAIIDTGIGNGDRGDVPGYDNAGGGRAGVFDYGSVFCCEGSGWVCG